MKANHVAKLRQIELDACVERTRMQMRYSRDVRKIMHRTWANQQAAQDHGHRQFIKAIRV